MRILYTDLDKCIICIGAYRTHKMGFASMKSQFYILRMAGSKPFLSKKETVETTH